MESIKITPGRLFGSLKIPPSKSIAHRAIISAGLAEGTSIIDNVDFSQDIIATIDALKALGVHIDSQVNNPSIKENTLSIGGVKDIKILRDTIECYESGSTLRFFIPITALSGQKVTFTGKGKLVERPLDIYYRIFDRQNIRYYNNMGKLPLTIEGRLKPDSFELEGNISSQFITGLMFSLPLLQEDSRITITNAFESKGYVDMTRDVLKDFSIEVSKEDENKFYIKGNQKYKGTNYRVEGDFSQAAFWLVGGIISGEIQCKDLKLDSLQGDRVILDIIKTMGGRIENIGGNVLASQSETKATTIDASQCPDLVPILAVLASFSLGTTQIINAQRVRIKESDRLKAIATELNKLGGQVEELRDALIITGQSTLKGGMVDSWNDHRIAMALAIAATRCKEPVTITNSDVVKKSYPGFWEDFIKVGGEIDGWNMGN